MQGTFFKNENQRGIINIGFQNNQIIDPLTKVEADTIDKVKEIIKWKVRNLIGVKSTLTMIVMR
ncbi:MAG TPA: hypothetical protein VHJ38_06610 [Nitrososphaeraceae archaeon]|nr:hypothetical protein [Nitrososphaeraceae archaeon]